MLRVSNRQLNVWYESQRIYLFANKGVIISHIRKGGDRAKSKDCTLRINNQEQVTSKMIEQSKNNNYA